MREAAGTAESTAIGTVRADHHRLSASGGGQKVRIWTVYCGQRHDVGFPRISAVQTRLVAGKPYGKSYVGVNYNITFVLALRERERERQRERQRQRQRQREEKQVEREV